ncbi:glycosyltransferase [Salegentibacter chungangensis]|uniref:Glycosyltransferase n=1 Tax=Salegentibacter chungangensis TaxID=1335724 RepID=A0ABW3NQE4_9FLAO
MRILQLIDSLRPGGAERMAVNLANELNSRVEASFLCCTRKEGLLKKEIHRQIGYLFLNKKSKLDVNAFLRLRHFILQNKINIIQAHGTSWFFGVLLKFAIPSVKLIWHDHYGNSDILENRNERLLKFFSYKFDGVIAVNQKLKKWAISTLKVSKVIQLNNFVVLPAFDEQPEDNSVLSSKGFNILCIANLRPQKDHKNLLNAFELIASEHEDIYLYMVGEDPKTDYSAEILEKISKSIYSSRIFYYGSQNPVTQFIKQANIAVLSSKSEGLPLVLLEYAAVGLPVVCTDTGECRKIISSNELLVPPENPEAIRAAVLKLYRNDFERKNEAEKMREKVEEFYGVENFISSYLDFCEKL